MLAADHYPDLHLDVAISNRQLFEIHHSKISLTRAKKGYDYPTIRLPFAFSRLIGLSTRIYQTVHDGALAFLVVVSSGSVGVSSPNKCENSFSRQCSPPSHDKDKSELHRKRVASLSWVRLANNVAYIRRRLVRYKNPAKKCGAIIFLAGIAFIARPAGILGAGFLDEFQHRRNEDQQTESNSP